MSRLRIYDAHRPAQPLFVSEDAARITATLAPLGVQFERWESPVRLNPTDSAEVILAAYRPYLDMLMGQKNAGSADVVKLTPDDPAAPALRRKFLAEHVHTEDEIRFFVHGSGHFILHIGARVYDVRCETGDLISVPAQVKHWFDAGEKPFFTALRVFTDTSGWVAHFTGDDIAKQFNAA